MKQIFLWLFVSAIAFGQGSPSPNPAPPSVAFDSPAPPEVYVVDCSKFDSSPGCTSYNELVSEKDKDIIGQVSGPAFVCFRPGEDAFSVLSYTMPNEVLYKPKNKYVSEAAGIISDDRFKNGVTENTQYAFGVWRKVTAPDAPEISFQTPPGSGVTSSIDSAELYFGYHYKNLGASITTYTLQIRKSTKRFIETFEFPDDQPTTPKGKIPVSKPTTRSRLEYTGHCAEFN